MLRVCKSICKLASKCLAHRGTTNTYFRECELVEGVPELEKDCSLFWDIKELHETTKYK